MTLHEYIQSYPRDQRTKIRLILAKAVNVSIHTILAWEKGGTKKGGRNTPHDKVLSIEKATKRKVTRYDLRPDIYAIEALMKKPSSGSKRARK